MGKKGGVTVGIVLADLMHGKIGCCNISAKLLRVEPCFLYRALRINTNLSLNITLCYAADAVIHTAFNHSFTDYGVACRMDLDAIKVPHLSL